MPGPEGTRIIRMNPNAQQGGILSSDQINGIIEVMKHPDPTGIASDLLRKCHESLIKAERELEAVAELRNPEAQFKISSETEGFFTLKERNKGYEGLGPRAGGQGIPAEHKRDFRDQLGSILRTYVDNVIKVFGTDTELSNNHKQRLTALLKQAHGYIQTLPLEKQGKEALLGRINACLATCGDLSLSHNQQRGTPGPGSAHHSSSNPFSPSSDFSA
jgi:hypothetical protein